MNPQEVLQLIDIATQLASVIEANVTASNDTETLAAWNQAKSMFAQGLTAAQREADTAIG